MQQETPSSSIGRFVTRTDGMLDEDGMEEYEGMDEGATVEFGALEEVGFGVIPLGILPLSLSLSPSPHDGNRLKENR